LVDWLDPPGDYNFEHYRLRHLAAEFVRTWGAHGALPGEEAPDFELTSTRGDLVRLRGLRGRPIVLHFVSYTCPITRGSVQQMAELHGLYSDRIEFVDLVVRQAHPGERRGPYRTFEEKMDDARRYQEEEAVTWTVLVDDLEGTVQRAYAGMCAPVYLIDAQGIVAFYGMWGQAPALRTAIDDLLARGGTGAPAGQGLDRWPHLAGAIVYGRGGPARGGLRALVDLELGFPGAFFLMTSAGLARPILAPLVLRTAPLPAKTKVGLAAAFIGTAAGLVCLRACSPHREKDSR
jgi:hypothetical protein